jgi:hypothetical protein
MADQAVTLATASSATRNIKIEQLSAEQMAHTGFTHYFRIPHDILNNASWTGQGDTVTVTLGSTPARYIVDRAAIDISTVFANTGTLTVSLGTSANTALLIAATTAKTAGLINSSGAPANACNGTSAATLQARFTTQASTGAPADITGGVCDVFMRIIDVADLS